LARKPAPLHPLHSREGVEPLTLSVSVDKSENAGSFPGSLGSNPARYFCFPIHLPAVALRCAQFQLATATLSHSFFFCSFSIYRFFYLFLRVAKDINVAKCVSTNAQKADKTILVKRRKYKF